jgi:hypothetical protein
VLVAGLAPGLAVTESAAQSTTPGVSSFFRVGGRVAHPRGYRLADLKALPAHTVDVSFQGPGGIQSQSFTGALLSDIETAAAPRFDADRKHDFRRWTARVHPSDNCEVVVATGGAERQEGRALRQQRQPDCLQSAAVRPAMRQCQHKRKQHRERRSDHQAGRVLSSDAAKSSTRLENSSRGLRPSIL